MFDSNFFEEISKRLTEALPESAKVMRADVEKHFRAILQNAFAKLDLVTREEFDVQSLILSKTRAKLEKLEQGVAGLEKIIAQKNET